MAASVSLLLQFNPVKRNQHHRSSNNNVLLSAACKSRIELSRRSIPIKCASSRQKNQHPPAYDDDDVSKNRFLEVLSDVRTDELGMNWEGVALAALSMTMYRGPMPAEFFVVFPILVHLTWMAACWGVEVPRMIHETTTSVIKLQVGLMGMGCSLIQKKLHHIAQASDASTLKGLNHVSTELSMALLRHSDYCIFGYSSVDVKMSPAEWKKRFGLLSIEERGKHNVKNIWTPSSSGQNYKRFNNEGTVVTILVAVKGLHKLPSISRNTDLKEALLTIASIIPGNTLAVEVFWTPRNENDTLWEQTLLKDYPLLKQL